MECIKKKKKGEITANKNLIYYIKFTGSYDLS